MEVEFLSEMSLPACMITQCHNPADYRLDKEGVLHTSECYNNFRLIFIQFLDMSDFVASVALLNVWVQIKHQVHYL
jgi:hypothetical protein